LLPEIGPERLNRELEKYIWQDKAHLNLKDLWEYVNRYTYLPRLKNRETLIMAVQAAITGMLPGPFAYAERFKTQTSAYVGLSIEKSLNPLVTIDSESIIIGPDVAEANRPAPNDHSKPTGQGSSAISVGGDGEEPSTQPAAGAGGGTDVDSPTPEPLPKRFQGTVMLSADRPARDMHQIVEAIVEQLTTLQGADVSLRLEIDAEVASGLDRSKVRTLMENASTLNFIDKAIK
jgi:hypothetical protein